MINVYQHNIILLTDQPGLCSIDKARSNVRGGSC
jgi:hypothetical protein